MPGTFIDDPFEVAIKDGNVLLTYPCGETTVIPVRVMRIMAHRVLEKLAEHDEHIAEIIRLRPDED